MADKSFNIPKMKSSNIGDEKQNTYARETEEFWNNFLRCHPQHQNFVLQTKLIDLIYKATYKVLPELLPVVFLTCFISGTTGPNYYKKKYDFMTDKLLSELKKFSPYFETVLATKKDIIEKGWQAFKTRWIFYVCLFIYIKIINMFIGRAIMPLVIYLGSSIVAEPLTIVTFIILTLLINYTISELHDIYNLVTWLLSLLVYCIRKLK